MSSSSDIPSSLLGLSNNLADVVEQAGSAVVAVNARHRIPSSGVHWRNGIIVTADHTVRRDEEITVTLPDNRTVPANLVGRDSSNDLAVLRLSDTQTQVAESRGVFRDGVSPSPPELFKTFNASFAHLLISIALFFCV